MDFIGFDFKAALKICMNASIYCRMLGKFNDGMLNELKDAVAGGSPADIQAKAHAIKGVSANLGFTDLYALSFTVEQKAKAGATVPADDADFVKLADTYNYVLDRAKAIVADPSLINPYI